MCREGRYDGLTRGVALGFLQCNLVVLNRRHAYDFLVYCQRNQRSCPVLEICDAGNPEPRELAQGADLRTDLPRYAVYRDGVRGPDLTDARELWQPDSVAFLIGSGISFDQALEEAGVPTGKNRWVLRTSVPTKPAGPFRGNLVVTMRWLSAEQSIRAVQVTSRFPFNHGAPIHIGNPSEIGADLEHPLAGPAVDTVPEGMVAMFWACWVTPQEAAIAAKPELMFTHAPAHGFVTDRKARDFALL
jgi:uncharacterized protein YcsI (UPF0317 family)